jgi:hypothetical protein
MLPIIPKPGISPRRKSLAIAIAGFADLLQLAVFPAFAWGGASPFDDALDFVVAALLVAICGFKWQFVVGFMAELVPGLALFPTWTAVALVLPTERPQRVNVTRGEAEGHDEIRVTARVVDPSAEVGRPPVQAPPVQPAR